MTSFKQEFLLGSCGYAPFNLAKLARDLTRPVAIRKGNALIGEICINLARLSFFSWSSVVDVHSCLTGYLIVKIDGLPIPKGRWISQGSENRPICRDGAIYFCLESVGVYVYVAIFDRTCEVDETET